MIEEIGGLQDEYTRQQRWAHLLTIGAAILMILYGLNVRAGTINATQIYDNAAAGVRVNYPANWLIDESSPYVFRVRDMTRIGFKTTIQIETRPAGSQSTPSTIMSQLDLNRAPITDSYDRIENNETYIFSDETEGLRGEYAFVFQDPNPFLQSIPIVVRGTDVITIRGGQAIIITFLVDATAYDSNIAIFERFLASLEL